MKDFNKIVSKFVLSYFSFQYLQRYKNEEIYQRLLTIIQMSNNQSGEESFYSIRNSKTQFTFIQQQQTDKEKEEKVAQPQDILQKFDIRQSSAILYETSENILNKSFQSVNNPSEAVINLHDISEIPLQQQLNELECSVCLQNEIDCLSVPEQANNEQTVKLKLKIDKLKKDQENLKKQVSIFQEMLALTQSNNRNLAEDVMIANKFIKKSCQHTCQNAGQNISSKIIQQPNKQSIASSQQRRYEIKPNLAQLAAQKESNMRYKQCSFNRTSTFLIDKDNQFKIELVFGEKELQISIVNYQKGQTNFLHAIRINQPQYVEKISQKIFYPINFYIPKKFTVSLSIILIIFEQNMPKQQQNLIKIEQIRTISIPLPTNYFIQPRFIGAGLEEKYYQTIIKKMCIYQIDIQYSGDYTTYSHLLQQQWIHSKWLSFKESKKLLWVEVGKMQQKNGDFRVIFKVGCRQKDQQQAIDLIQYLCFMLVI